MKRAGSITKPVAETEGSLPFLSQGDELGHLTGGQAVHERARSQVREDGTHGRTGFARRPLDEIAPEWVRAVQDDKLDGRFDKADLLALQRCGLIGLEYFQADLDGRGAGSG